MSRDRQILDAALLAFHERGFHGVGVDEIGRRAGLSGPAIYRHFPGKDAILATLLDEAMDQLTEHMDDLDAALAHHVRFVLAQRQLVGVYHRESPSLVEPWSSAFARRRAAYTRRWEALVAQAYPHAPAHLGASATQALLGMVFSVWAWPERAVVEPGVDALLLRMLNDSLSSWT